MRKVTDLPAVALAKRVRIQTGPGFRELEPDWQMAQTGGNASRRCLIGVDDASRL